MNDLFRPSVLAKLIAVRWAPHHVHWCYKFRPDITVCGRSHVNVLADYFAFPYLRRQICSDLSLQFLLECFFRLRASAAVKAFVAVQGM